MSREEPLQPRRLRASPTDALAAPLKTGPAEGSAQKSSTAVQEEFGSREFLRRAPCVQTSSALDTCSCDMTLPANLADSIPTSILVFRQHSDCFLRPLLTRIRCHCQAGNTAGSQRSAPLSTVDRPVRSMPRTSYAHEPANDLSTCVAHP